MSGVCQEWRTPNCSVEKRPQPPVASKRSTAGTPSGELSLNSSSYEVTHRCVPRSQRAEAMDKTSLLMTSLTRYDRRIYEQCMLWVV